jgi:hypothetical protein
VAALLLLCLLSWWALAQEPTARDANGVNETRAVEPSAPPPAAADEGTDVAGERARPGASGQVRTVRPNAASRTGVGGYTRAEEGPGAGVRPDGVLSSASASSLSLTVPQAVLLSLLSLLPLVAVVWALHQAKATLKMVSSTLARNMSDVVANEVRVGPARVPPVQSRTGRGTSRANPRETYEMRRTQQKTIHNKLDALQNKLSKADSLVEAIAQMRRELFAEMQAVGDKQMNAVWADYQDRFKRKIDDVNRQWRESHEKQKADFDAKTADREADFQAKLRQWEKHADGLNTRLEETAQQLNATNESLENTAAILTDTEKQRDRWKNDYQSKVDELTIMAQSVHPSLYEAFNTLFAGLKAQVSATSTVGDPDAFFSFSNNRFRTLYHLCLAMMSLREEIRRADDDAAGVDDLKLEMRELFRHLDAMVYEFREDDEVLRALREQLGAILNKTILSGIYECSWPAIGSEVDERYHYLNEIGGNLICEVKTGTLMDANSGEVVFKAVVDTGN